MAEELKAAILELLSIWDNTTVDGHTSRKGDCAAQIIGLIQTHLIASVLGRDIASRRPVLGVLLWYADVFLRRACNQQKKMNDDESVSNEVWSSSKRQKALDTIYRFIPPLLVSIRVVLRYGWVQNIVHLKSLMQNAADLFRELSQHMAVQLKNSSSKTTISQQLLLLLANVASESCNQVLIQFPSVSSKRMRLLMESCLFQGGLQVGTNGKSLSTILGQVDETDNEKPMHFAQHLMEKKISRELAPERAAHVIDELSPPRLRRMSTHLEEDSFLREIVDGNIWTQKLQAKALSKDRRARFRKRVTGDLADRAERAVVAALIKHCGMLVDAHTSMKEFMSERNRHPQSAVDNPDIFPAHVLSVFLRARSIRDWLQRIKGRTDKSINELSLVVIERAALLLTVKPSSNVPRLPYNDVDLRELNDHDAGGQSKEDASMTHRHGFT